MSSYPIQAVLTAQAVINHKQRYMAIVEQAAGREITFSERLQMQQAARDAERLRQELAESGYGSLAAAVGGDRTVSQAQAYLTGLAPSPGIGRDGNMVTSPAEGSAGQVEPVQWGGIGETAGQIVGTATGVVGWVTGPVWSTISANVGPLLTIGLVLALARMLDIRLRVGK